jgi:dTDP-glucose 4,6-dehydratase
VRVVILGAAGFLGSHLCDHYLNQSCEVIGVDNLSSGSLGNLNHLADNHRFSFIEQDICEPLQIDGEINLVCNFASLASPGYYVKQAIQTLRTGSLGTESALELARSKNARMVMASTSEIYGDPLVHPQTEFYRGNVSSTGPRSMYDEAKRYSEALCSAYVREFGCNIGILRIFNTYGPRLARNDGRVISNFITQALSNKPLTVYGSGSQTRSFCYVSDLVQGIVAMGESDAVGPINLGNPEEFTIMELVDVLSGIIDEQVTIDYRPLPQDDPVRRCPDISLARETLCWEPTISLVEGLRLSIDWYLNN